MYQLPAYSTSKSVVKDDLLRAAAENTPFSALEVYCTSMLPPSLVLLTTMARLV